MCAVNGKDGRVKPYSIEDLPPEFRWFEKPLGLEQHVFNRIVLGLGHAFFLYTVFYLYPFGYIPFKAFLFGLIYTYVAVIGSSAGTHRLWSHKTYKAKRPLRYLIVMMQSAGGWQYPIFKWARDHRIHHKFMDTDADPHSAARGFWFSHMGWLLTKKHPDLEEKLRTFEVADLVRDPVLQFQCKYYLELVVLMFIIVPMSAYALLCPEMHWFHGLANHWAYYCVSQNLIYCINSVAHIFGDKPYDRHMSPTDSKWLHMWAVGESFHNYHHTFPWDYKSAEFSYFFNLATLFIDFFAWLGWAYDLKTVSQKMIRDRINRTGDGSHPWQNQKHEFTSGNDMPKVNNSTKCWGLEDEELQIDDPEIIETKFPAITKVMIN